MATPVVGGTVWQYIQYWTRGGSKFLVTQLLQDKNDTDFTDYAASAAAFLAKQLLSGGSVVNIASLMSTNYVLEKHSMQPLYPKRLRTIVEEDAGSTAGALTGTPLPPNSAATIQKYSDQASRWGWGVSHMPLGVAASQNTDGSWTSSFLTNLSSFAATWIGDWLSTDPSHVFRPVLWSPKNPSRITSIIGTVVGTAIRVMVRRTLGRGI